MKVSLEVNGLEKAFQKLDAVKLKTFKKAEDRMYILLSSAAGAVRTRMPGWIWDTGYLAGNIDHLVRWETGQLVGYVFTPVEYGIYVHFGTYKMRPRPFMDIAIYFLSANLKNVFQGLI